MLRCGNITTHAFKAMDSFIQVKEHDLNILFVAAMATVAMMLRWEFMQENRVWYWGIEVSEVFISTQDSLFFSTASLW